MANPDPHIEELHDAPPQQLHQDQLQPQQEDEIVYEEEDEDEDEDEEDLNEIEDDEDEEGFDDDDDFEEEEEDDNDEDEEEVGGDFSEDEEGNPMVEYRGDLQSGSSNSDPAENGTGVDRGEACSSSGLENIEDSERNGWNRNEIDGLFCSICMEAWTNDGDHNICCLPCGHIYGMSCINRWLQQRRNSAKCPQCNRKCKLKDVRKLFASRIVAIDEESQKRIQSLEAKCASLERKNADWRKKAAEWQKREAELCLKVVQYMELKKTGTEPSPIPTFKVTHTTHQDKKIYEYIEAAQSASATMGLYREAIGEQNHGHVLGMSVGIRPRDVFGDSSQSSGRCWRQTQHLEENAALHAKIGDLKAQLQQMQTAQAEEDAQMDAWMQTQQAQQAQMRAELAQLRAQQARMQAQMQAHQAQTHAFQLQLVSMMRPSPAATTTNQTLEDEEKIDNAHMEDNG